MRRGFLERLDEHVGMYAKYVPLMFMPWDRWDKYCQVGWVVHQCTGDMQIDSWHMLLNGVYIYNSPKFWQLVQLPMISLPRYCFFTPFFTGLFLSCWLLMAPFVIFQALIAARDDGHTSSVTHVGSVIPLLVLLGWVVLCSLGFVLRYRTPYQELQEFRMHAAAGTAVLYRV